MLDKAIAARKEHRRPYYRSQRFDRSCRPHGGCPYCERARLYADNRARTIAAEKLREAFVEE